MPERVVWRAVGTDTARPNSEDRGGDAGQISFRKLAPASAVDALLCGRRDADTAPERGDRTISIDGNETWLATNQCSAANGHFISNGGAPMQPGELIIGVNAGGKGNCKSRARMLWVPTWDGKPVMSPYIEKERSAQDEVQIIPPGCVATSRSVCAVTTAVTTRQLKSGNPPPNCPL